MVKLFPVAALSVALLGIAPAHAAGITYLGKGSIPGNARDDSGLRGLLEDGVTPANQVGGLGSALAWSGRGDLYYAAPDRGPADGATTYRDRLYAIEIRVRKTGPSKYGVQPILRDTTLLRNEDKAFFTGSSAAFDATGSTGSLRFDPEGIRVSRCGDTAFVSDEYGPYLYEFDLGSGRRVRSVGLPAKFGIDAPSAVVDEELGRNVAGRQTNRGMEGLAISPDGRRVYGMMQNALLQDGALDAANKRVGMNNRIVEVDTESGAVREFAYVLDDKGNGVNEILAINDHEFLVIERDGKAGAAAAFKKLFRIDTSGATDVRAVKQLPAGALPAEVVPVAKAPFLDLLDPAFGLAGAEFPEKIEAIAFGPDLDDGRHLLIVVNDNDFFADRPTNFYAFAIEPWVLPGFEAQRVGGFHRDCRRHRD
jgi:hypothetical protein